MLWTSKTLWGPLYVNSACFFLENQLVTFLGFCLPQFWLAWPCLSPQHFYVFFHLFYELVLVPECFYCLISQPWFSNLTEFKIFSGTPLINFFGNNIQNELPLQGWIAAFIELIPVLSDKVLLEDVFVIIIVGSTSEGYLWMRITCFFLSNKNCQMVTNV